MQVSSNGDATLKNKRVRNAFVCQMNVARKMRKRATQIVNERQRRISVRSTVEKHLFVLRLRQRALHIVMNVDDINRFSVRHVQDIVHEVVRQLVDSGIFCLDVEQRSLSGGN